MRLLKVLPLLLFVPACPATTIAVLFTNTQIVVAADSRITFTSSSGGNTITRWADQCKIHVFENLVGAVQGMYSEPVSGFDAGALLEQAVSEGGSVHEVADRAAALITPRLAEAMKSSTIKSRGSNLKFFVAGFTGVGEVVVRYVEYPVGAKAPVAKNLYGKSAMRTLFIGQTVGMHRLTAVERHLLMDRPLAEAARGLLQAEIDFGTVGVGPPISELVINRQGLRWVQPGLCTPPATVLARHGVD